VIKITFYGIFKKKDHFLLIFDAFWRILQGKYVFPPGAATYQVRD